MAFVAGLAIVATQRVPGFCGKVAAAGTASSAAASFAVVAFLLITTSGRGTVWGFGVADCVIMRRPVRGRGVPRDLGSRRAWNSSGGGPPYAKTSGAARHARARLLLLLRRRLLGRKYLGGCRSVACVHEALVTGTKPGQA